MSFPERTRRLCSIKGLALCFSISGLIVLYYNSNLSTRQSPQNEGQSLDFDFKDIQLTVMRKNSTDVGPMTKIEMPLTSRRCNPIRRIVFLKTHKTASTTTASIFERYGYYRQLNFAVGRSHVLSFPSSFSHENVSKFPKMKGKPYDILCNHARYNRNEMDLVVPNATYVTILRRPEDQLESSFYYFEMFKGMRLRKKNALHTFMDDPMKYYKTHNFSMWQLSRNGQLFDLGFDHRYDDNETMIKKKVREIDRDFHLVLITEFYDESLILLKKILCWDFEDILYIANGIRNTRYRFHKDEGLTEKLKRWNHGDRLLYEYFNKTLWEKIADYGSSFYTDLEYFRQLNHAVFKECIKLDDKDNQDPRETKFVLKNNTERCAALLRGDVGYTNLIRNSMLNRLSKSWYDWIPFI